MFGFGKKKKVVEEFKKEVMSSFNSVKKDFEKVGGWIDHIDGKHRFHGDEIETLKGDILMLKSELEEVKDLLSFFGPNNSSRVFKQAQTPVHKQQGVVAVQTPVQTPVQTSILDGLTVMERAIVWAIINSEMKLSYDDLAAILGKSKSTIRGQINTIKQKSESLIQEYSEPNGKKRLFVPEEIKQILLKSAKVRVNKTKKTGKN
jgi:predicted transcriptional regulator